MGCASSAPQETALGPKQQEAPYNTEHVEGRGISSSSQEALFTRELTQLVCEATNATKTKDAWAVLYKCADLICSAFGVKTCSLVIYTSSGHHGKLACNTGSVLNELVQQYPDLIPSESLGFATSVLSSMKSICIKAGDEAWASMAHDSHPDFALLSGSRGGCTALAVLPLCGGLKCPGVLLLGHTAPLAGLVTQTWLATLLPLLSLHVAESYLVRNLSLIEKVTEAASLSGLAFAVTSELGEIFEWCHREDVEARLVVLASEGETATVYCKLPAASVLSDDRTSLRSALSGSVVRSGPNALLEEGLLGSHMSLDNTLTKRCLTGRQRLLFVADVLQALKLYGEPWKDIFFDNAAVLNPSWVLAAPLVHEGRRLGAVLWLSSCRVNPEVLMRTASMCASPIIHAVTRAAAVLQLCPNGGAQGVGPGAAAGAASPLGDSAYSKSTLAGGGGGGNSQYGLSSFTQPCSRQSSTLSRGRTGRLNIAGGHEDSLAARGSADHEVMLGDLDGGGSRVTTSVPDIPVKYVLRHSPSTSALMRMYKSTIAQRAPATDEERSAGSVHEIRILSKAGEGAFGSVYVGRWRNIVVAVKIIKDTTGTRSLKTAWELAVNKSLSHPSIVTVHAILTDVHLQKTAPRVLRFVPAATLEAQQAAAALAAANGSPSSASSNPGGVIRTATLYGPAAGPAAAAADGGLGDAAPISPSCPLPSKASAPAALGTPGGGAAAAGVGALRSSLGGHPPPATLASPAPYGSSGGVGGAAGTPPSFSRVSTGSNAGPSSASAAAALLLKSPAKSNTPKVHAILMEYCNLGGLHKYIDNRMFFKNRTMADKATELARVHGPLPPEQLHMDFILATLSEVASALQYLHAQGFVHCDLKPENVLLKEANNRRGFTAKLADFGLSELRSVDGQVLGDLGGTVTHVAPESVLHRQVSAASDMYAFGILMWELYTGQQPYRALLSHINKREDRHRALLARVVHEGLRPLFPPGVPQDYWNLAMQCWSSDPAARPTTGEVLQALEVMYGKYASPPPQGADPLNTTA